MHRDWYMNAALAYCAGTGVPAVPEMVDRLANERCFRAAVEATLEWAWAHPFTLEERFDARDAAALGVGISRVTSLGVRMSTDFPGTPFGRGDTITYATEDQIAEMEREDHE